MIGEKLTQEATFSSEEIWQTLNLDRVASHVRRMFKIGADLRQESAFAVYDNGRKQPASKLLIPEVTNVSADSAENMAQTMSVSAAPLIRRYIDSDSTTREERNSDNADIDETVNQDIERMRQHSLSESAQIAIQNIQNDMSLSCDDKARLIEKVSERDYRKTKEVNVRDDIKLLAHNHPALHGYGVDQLLIPSEGDIFSYVHVRKHNPKLVEMIVATDEGRNSSKALLFAAPVGADIASGQYSIDQQAMRARGGPLARLSAIGIKWTMFDLGEDGRPLVAMRKIQRFARELNT